MIHFHLLLLQNYVDHCTEQNVPIPKEPLTFGKYGSCVIGPGAPIAVDTMTEKLDYEVELGVVIGRTIPRHSTQEEAMAGVGAYTVIHDVSARDWQLEKNGGQWLLGKAVDGYAPIGPVLVTTDELSHEQAHSARIRCRINGETLQDSNTNQLVFNTGQILEFLSQFMTFFPGDIIATGTPPGVGCFRKPTPRWLVPGDVVECEIDGIGTLTNPIVAQLAKTTVPAALPLAKIGNLANMTCVVTGGKQGIGYGIAVRLAMEGAAHVALVDLGMEQLTNACSQLKATVPSCQFTPHECNVTDFAAVEATFKAIAEKSQYIHVLVQAAGVVGATNVQTEDVDPENFESVLKVNVNGIFNGCKAALPYMVKQEYGRIVNIASISGKEGNAGMLAYSTSKAAVIGLTKATAKEYAHGSGDITVNSLAPAVVRTQMVEDMPPEQVKYMTDKIPMKRCGTIGEIASLVAFIASKEASFTTGFCFDATGGRAVY